MARLVSHLTIGKEPGGVRTGHEDGTAVVWLWGEHDLATVEALGSALVEAVTTTDGDVVVDLARVTFMDGSTLGCLVRGQNLLSMSKTRTLTIRNPSTSARQLFQVSGLAGLIAGDGQRAPAVVAR